MNEALVLLIVIPLASAILAGALGPKRADAVRWVSLASTLVSLVLSVGLAWDLAAQRLESSPDLKMFEPQYQTKVIILPLEKDEAGGAIHFHVGLDGISVWLVVLTTLLMLCAVLGSWASIRERVNEYYAWMLALQMAMVGVFLAMDVILFYVFFELTLIPLFFLIGIWGGPQRQYAARKFFVFTLTGSLITLLGVLGAVLIFATEGYTVPDRTVESGVREVRELTLSIPRLVELNREAMKGAEACEQALADGAIKEKDRRLVKDTAYWFRVQFWIFLAMMVGFAVKVPLFPLHTWLPLAHVEAPTAGSVLLAGVLLKLGTYGFLRLCIPLAPDASVTFGAPFIGTLAVIGIIYGAFCALMQDDIKKMVAYSSVSHLGVCVLGLFALNEAGIMGSLLQMVNHGLSTGALFLLVGMLYDRYHTRKIADYGGMAARLKLLALFMVFMTMSSIGLPGLNGFVGELLSLMGMFSSKVSSINGIWFSTLGAVGVVLGAWYMLSLVRDVFFGPLKEPHHGGHQVPDLNGREIATLVPIAVVCLVIGLYSPGFTKVAEPETRYVATLTKEAQGRHPLTRPSSNE